LIQLERKLIPRVLHNSSCRYHRIAKLSLRTGEMGSYGRKMNFQKEENLLLCRGPISSGHGGSGELREAWLEEGRGKWNLLGQHL